MPQKSRASRILVADDDKTIRGNLALLLRSEGYEVVEAVDGTEAAKYLTETTFQLALLDLKMPGLTGLELLSKFHDLFSECPAIVITAYGGSQAAIEAMKLGAFDYITKPFDLDEVVFTVRRALTQQSLIDQVRSFEEMKSGEVSVEPKEEFIGRSPSMLEIFKTIGRIANTSESVLILGETGTGKELVASAIQASSSRAQSPFVKINCAALSATLLESELFGHERGAFTGAVSQRIGRFEQANGGTIFLDELGDLDLTIQAKLLRVLQFGEFERLGGNATLKTDVRLISATNRDLNSMVAEKQFREDLLYRLNVVTIKLPPLRDRREDIPVLAEHFVRQLAMKYNWPQLVLTEEAADWLERQPWQGNVRQLRNLIARAATLSRGRPILIGDLHSNLQNSDSTCAESPITNTEESFDLKSILAQTEQRVIERALKQTKWNRTQAAELLGISRRQLFDKIAQYHLQEDSQ